MKGRAFAKVNLSLRVGALRGDGLHSIQSLAQSVDWADAVTLTPADSDELIVHGADLPADETNLAWRAVERMRPGASPAVRLELDKSIAVAAGLGGGSADAAVSLALAAEVFGRSVDDAVAAAPGLGSDVPFCLSGGCAVVEGVGEIVSYHPTPSDYALAVVVPPFELATPGVYSTWDRMDGPSGPEIRARYLPVSVRDHAPLVNDLTPAAILLMPELGDWISDLRSSWGTAVAMSGSGPSLFAFFGSLGEARDAARVVSGARSVVSAGPVAYGWQMESGSTLPPPPWGVV